MTSTVISMSPQSNGRAYVRERHIDAHGVAHEVEYLADPGTDYEAVMLARVPQIEQALRQQELDRIEDMVLQGIAAIDVAPPLYVTPDEAYAYLFTKFSAEPDATKLLKAAGFISLFQDAELRAYGMNDDLIAVVRQRAAEIQAIASAVAAYTPPMGGL